MLFLFLILRNKVINAGEKPKLSPVTKQIPGQPQFMSMLKKYLLDGDLIPEFWPGHIFIMIYKAMEISTEILRQSGLLPSR